MASPGHHRNRSKKNDRGNRHRRGERQSKWEGDTSGSLDPFIELLHDIAEEISPEELKKMKFLCRNRVPKVHLQEVVTTQDLFSKLLDCNLISDKSIAFLEELLNRLKRNDLLERVKTACHQSGSSDDEKSENFLKEKNVGNKRTLDEMMEGNISDDSRSYRLRPRAGEREPFREKCVDTAITPTEPILKSRNKEGSNMLKDIKPSAGKRQNDITVQVVGIPNFNDKKTPFLQFPVSDQRGTIRSCVAFGHVAAELHLKIRKDSGYILRKYKVRKPKNIQYNPDPFEILLDEGTEINDYLYPENSFKQLSSQSKLIYRALKTEERSHVIGQITRTGDVNRIPGKNTVYREIHVVDQSCQETKVRLFGENATKFQDEVGQVVQITFVRGTTRDGQCYLVTTVDTEIHQSNVEIQLDKYNPAPKTPQTTLKISSLQEIELANPGTYDIENIYKIDTISLRKPHYFGCPNTNCKTKVQPGSNETCVCPRDGYECAPEFYWKIRVGLTDHTATIWVTLFDKHLCDFPTLKKEIRKLPASQRNKIIKTALENAKVKVTIKKGSERSDGNYNLIDIFKMK